MTSLASGQSAMPAARGKDFASRMTFYDAPGLRHVFGVGNLLYGFDAHSLVLDPKSGKAYYGIKQLDWSISKLPCVQLNRGAVLSWLTRGVHLCDDLSLDTPICGALSSLLAWTWNVETLLFIFDTPLKLHSSWQFHHYPMCVFCSLSLVHWSCVELFGHVEQAHLALQLANLTFGLVGAFGFALRALDKGGGRSECFDMLWLLYYLSRSLFSKDTPSAVWGFFLYNMYCLIVLGSWWYSLSGPIHCKQHAKPVWLSKWPMWLCAKTRWNKVTCLLPCQ